MKPLRFSALFFSVILLLAVSQVASAQPSVPVLLQPPDLINVTPESLPNVQNTTPLLQWVSQDMPYRIEISSIEKNEEIIVVKKEIPEARYKVLLADKLDRFKVYYWQVTAINTERVESRPSEKRKFKTGDFQWACGDPGIDDDCDGISNEDEERIGTNPGEKTLFVRPIIDPGDEECHDWNEFTTELFPDPRPNPSPGLAFASIKPFKNAGIEIVVISCSSNIPDDLPCSILTIVHKGKKELAKVYCAYGSHGNGHTYFTESGITVNQNGEEEITPTWSWDRKGYTPKSSKTSEDYYYSSNIFPFPIRNYFREGAYQKIEEGEEPKVTDCNTSNDNCIKKKWVSPMNLEDTELPTDPPSYTNRPDDTVEFNPICFDKNGKIKGKPLRGETKYDYNSVLKRTIVHEMGHAILGADEGDHCANPKCIMYKYTIDWKMHDFGGHPCESGAEEATPRCCEHQPGGRQDIRANGMIFNTRK